MSLEPDVVAVIDDDAMMRRALKVLLSACGYMVELYESSEAFLQRAATCNAVCLLVDVRLGSGSGFDLAQRLSESGFEFPIIFMTANADKTVLRRAMDAGGLGCLQKPFTGDLLMGILTKSKKVFNGDQ